MERSTELFDDLLDVLVAEDAERVLRFRLPDTTQHRLRVLIGMSRDGTISDREQAELDTFKQLEHVVRLLKARLLQDGNQR